MFDILFFKVIYEYAEHNIYVFAAVVNQNFRPCTFHILLHAVTANVTFTTTNTPHSSPTHKAH